MEAATMLPESGAKAATSTGSPGAAEIGVVVIGGDYQGLGIVRSLGRRGIPVCVIDDEMSIARHSRFCTHFMRVKRLRGELEIVEALLDAAKRLKLDGWVLYPTREELVAAISLHRERLQRTFRVPTAEWDSVQWAWDKRNTYRLAQEQGIPTPATHYPRNADDLRGLDAIAPPFVIKPAIKEHFIYATHAKAWRANSHAQLRELFLKAADLVEPGEIMVQEMIPGGGRQQFSYCAFFRDGEAVAKMIARRRRQHPLEFGRASTYVETVDVPVLEEYSERFLRACGYYGLVELEYKLDPRDQQYKLLDVNARTWGYHSIGASAGVDFSYMQYADQAGLPVERCRAREGVGWMRTVTDLPAALVAMRAGDTTPGEYLRSLRNATTEAVFSTDDPLPGLIEVLMIPYLAVKRGF